MRGRTIVACALLLICVVTAGMLARAQPPETPGPGWAHWRGPNRDGTTSETSGWEDGVWPPTDPLWRARVGSGGTSPVVAAGKIYTMGFDGGQDTVFCLDAASGRELWKTSYRCRTRGRFATGDTGAYSGPSATPELDTDRGRLYTLGLDGDLNCWDTTRAGRNVWHVNLYDAYGMRPRPKVGKSSRRDYGYTSSPMVYGDWLLIEGGGNAGTVMALSKATGTRIWRSQATDLAGHTAGPVRMTVDGVPCLAVLTLSNLLVVRLDRGHEGETVAAYPYQTEFANSIAGPAVKGNEVLITSSYNHDTITKLRVTLGGVTKVWEQKHASGVCTPAIHNNRVYWAWKRVKCLDFKTGRLLWEGHSGGAAGSCIVTADNRLIVWADQGNLMLVDTAEHSPGAFRKLADKSGVFRAEVWPHVALANRRLYCKDRSGNLVCYSLRKNEAIARQSSRPSAPPAPAAVVLPEKPVDLAAWPGDAPGLVLAWRRGLPAVVLGPGKKTPLKARGAVKPAADGTLDVSEGGFLIDGANERLLAACRGAGELSVEAVLMTHAAKQSGPARIVSFSQDGYHRNFTLGQEGERLVFRLRTPATGINGMRPETTLCAVRQGRWHHVLVTYRDGYLACYLDGRRVVESRRVAGDFRNWEPMHLVLGDEYEDARDWRGKIERVAVHCRFIGPGEALKRAELSRVRE